jgi:hypothetical protein
MGDRWARKTRAGMDLTSADLGDTGAPGNSGEQDRPALERLFDGEADPSRTADAEGPNEGETSCHDA